MRRIKKFHEDDILNVTKYTEHNIKITWYYEIWKEETIPPGFWGEQCGRVQRPSFTWKLSQEDPGPREVLERNSKTRVLET